MAPSLPTSIPVAPVVANLVRTRHRDRIGPDRVAAVQSRLLRGLVRHAVTRVPHYAARIDPADAERVRTPAELAALPVLDRETLSGQEVDQFLAEGFTAENTRAASTSGSSGFPVTLHYSEGDLGYLRASFLWDMLASGMRPQDRVGYLRVGDFRRHRLEKLGVARNVHVNTRLSLDEQADAFIAGRPNFLYGYPNAIVAVVEELRRRGVRYDGVRGVLFAGEKLAPDARAEVLDFLGARGHEAYASVEAYTIARTCPRGALHLRSADVVVEVEHDDGSVSVADGEGAILVTRLHAEAMPLLRYRLGDRVAITPNDCSCGVRSTPIVAEIKGRTADQVRTVDHRLRSAVPLFGTIDGIPGVRQSQFLQRRAGEVVLNVVTTAGTQDDVVRTALATTFARDVKDLQVEVRIVDRITPEPNGKIKLVKVAGAEEQVRSES